MLVGYIDSLSGNASIQDVTNQVGQYARWGATASNLTLDGIFFDHTPSGASDEEVEYLTQITQRAKNTQNLGKNFVSHFQVPYLISGDT